MTRYAFCVVATTLAAAAEAQVLHDHDNGPLTGVFGVPDSAEGGVVLGRGMHAWDLSAIAASHTIIEEQPGETLLLDGETSRLELRYRYGLGAGVELGIELPYVQHQPGRLDSVIDAWHDFFGLPQGNRPDRPQDELEFLYAGSSNVEVSIIEQSRGIGDVRLFAGWQLAASNSSATSLRFGIKMPTGDSRLLHGSGGTDVSVGLAGDATTLWGSDRLNGFYRASAVYVGAPDLMASRANRYLMFLSSGLGYFVLPNFELRAQFSLRSAAYESAVENLGESSVALTFGGNLRISDDYVLSLGVGEDIKVSSAPDVSFQIAIRYGAQE
jgi:hypothetical protein